MQMDWEIQSKEILSDKQIYAPSKQQLKGRIMIYIAKNNQQTFHREFSLLKY